MAVERLDLLFFFLIPEVVDFLCASSQVLGSYLKLRLNRSLPKPLQLIVKESCDHSTRH